MDINSNHQHDKLDELDNPPKGSLDDRLWNLLSADAKAYPIAPSPWFASRTVAQGRTRAQGQWNARTLLLRWLMPVPLAVLALVALLFSQGVGLQNLKDFGKEGAYSYVSTDSEFEQHMDLLSSTE